LDFAKHGNRPDALEIISKAMHQNNFVQKSQ
jgi:hypothetical protein